MLFFRFFVRQLSCSGPGQAINDGIREIYDARKENGYVARPLSCEETVSAVMSLLGRHSLTNIVIDALNECDRGEREYLLDVLSLIIQDSKGFKNCASSRNNLDIIYYHEDWPNPEIAASKNKADIFTFVRSEVERYVEKKRFLYPKVPNVLRNQI